MPLAGFVNRDARAAALPTPPGLIQGLWLRRGPATVQVYLLADLLYFPDHLAQRLRTFLADRYAIGPERLIAGATHTHTGPQLGFFAGTDPQVAYQERLFERLCASFPVAADFEPVRLARAEIALDATVSINRRRVLRRGPFRRTFLWPNPRNSPPTHLAALRVDFAHRRPVVLASLAVHPICDRSLHLGTDFPGALRAALRHDYRLLLFQGFGGDRRPGRLDHTPWYGARRVTWGYRLRRFLLGPGFPRYQRTIFLAFVEQLAAAFLQLRFQPLSVRTDAASIHHLPLPSRTGRSRKTLQVQLVQLGEVLFIGLNAEVFQRYEVAVRRSFPRLPIVLLGCVNGSVGYLPTPTAMANGGYEVSDAPIWNGMDAAFSDAAIARVEPWLIGCIRQFLSRGE